MLAKAESIIKENPANIRKTLIQAIGITDSQAKRLLKKFRAKGTLDAGSCSAVVPSTFRRGIQADDFCRGLDLPLKVREAVANLGSLVISDADFRTELKIPSTQWAAIRGLDEFSKNHIAIHGKIFWAQEKVINKVRATIDLV